VTLGSATRTYLHAVIDNNSRRIPHPAFNGQTPNEVYVGTGAAVPDELTHYP
jgi:hypothetical protein